MMEPTYQRPPKFDGEMEFSRLDLLVDTLLHFLPSRSPVHLDLRQRDTSFAHSESCSSRRSDWLQYTNS